MKKKIIYLGLSFLAATALASCNLEGLSNKTSNPNNIEVNTCAHDYEVTNTVAATCTVDGSITKTCTLCDETITETIPATGHTYEVVESVSATTESSGYITYKCSSCGDTYTKEIPMLKDYDATLATDIILADDGSVISNDNGGVVIENNTIIINLAGEYNLSGSLTNGNIIVDAEGEKVTLNLNGVSITSTTAIPLYIKSADKVEISAKNGTLNYINDNRETVADADGAAIYAECDLELKGKGTLNVEAKFNNGIATKDDLSIKNLTLSVKAINNALKGNDSLTISSGTITAISTSGDGLKTENSDVSSKGNQRGIITISGGKVDIMACYDGIDAAYDVVITGGEVNILTDSYSSYSSQISSVEESKLYLKLGRSYGQNSLSTSYKYVVTYNLDDGSTKDVTFTYNSSTQAFSGDIPSNAVSMVVSAYSGTTLVAQSNTLTMNSKYDCLSLTRSGTVITTSWTTYTTTSNPSFGGGFGGGFGPTDGNSNKSDYSSKGIKADNEITISDGTVTVRAHDDAIHANSDTALETGNYGTGNVTISGGTITVYSDDDGIHSDGILTVSGGTIIVESAYEGLEGNKILIENGNINVYATDDGINASGTNASITISGGIIVATVSSGDTDTIDSNGTFSQIGGIVIVTNASGTSGMASCLDTDSTTTITGGTFICFGKIENTPKLTNVTSKNVSGSFKAQEYGLYEGDTLIVKFTLKTSYSYYTLINGTTSYTIK